MNLGSGQDSFLEVVEEGKLFSTVENQADEEDVAKLRRAMEFLLPGLALAGLIPYVGGDWSLVAFIGTLVAVLGVFRLWEEGVWFKLSAVTVGLQCLCLCYQLVGQTLLPELLEQPLYPVAGYVAMVAGAATFLLLTVALWLYHKKSAYLMAAAALAGVALPVLSLFGGGLVLTVVRIVLVLVGAAGLGVLFVSAKQAPIYPE